VQPWIEVGDAHSSFTDTVSINRRGQDKTKVWFSIGSGGFRGTILVSPAEARQIGEAYIKAAEDAEEAARQLREEEDLEIFRQQRIELEDDRARDCEARGVEYSGPLSVCSEDIDNLRAMKQAGHELPKWGTELLDAVDAVQQEAAVQA
jgi:hypothetical protein